ncbi:efflux transporter outer membrane subunit [Trinickia sp. NRRL B-1857]|uniref:efflux transporter outer membrane subunit n=1 Tax=Trinickia sp. NRRL B-1857 TaxID=3162879 RepID=UPI003D2709B4
MQSFKRLSGLTAVATTTALTMLWLSGCASSEHRPELAWPALPASWSAASAETQPAHDAASPERWWARFGDTVLDELVETALANNADLAIAAIRVRRAQLEAGLVRAETGPQGALAAGVGATRAFGADRARVSTGVNAALSFELDLWGKLAARRDEASWRAQASEADRDVAALLLIGTTAKLYWGIGYLNESIALDQASIVDAQRTVEIVEARVAAGAASPLDAAQARGQLAARRADFAQTTMAREAKRNALALLLNRPPNERGAEPASLRDAAIPGVAASLPAVVLARRPDMRAAEARLRAQLANVDFARASIYPEITLTSEMGTSSDMLLRTLQNPVASLGAALALPFIQWNTVRRKAALSENEFAEASIAFRKGLYGALAEVEDALSAKTQLERQAEQRTHAFEEAKLAVSVARTRFDLGTTDAAPWLEAQRVQRSAELDRTANRLARLENRIDLFLALGGG